MPSKNVESPVASEKLLSKSCFRKVDRFVVSVVILSIGIIGSKIIEEGSRHWADQ